MLAQELRVGNYICYEQTTHVVSGVLHGKIYSWWFTKGVPVIEFINNTDIKSPYVDTETNYKPIPITEEWLLKIGFEPRRTKWDAPDYITEDRIELEQHGEKWALAIHGGESAPHLTQYFAHHTKYIHQLQNLVFALTGEELLYKP